MVGTGSAGIWWPKHPTWLTAGLWLRPAAAGHGAPRDAFGSDGAGLGRPGRSLGRIVPGRWRTACFAGGTRSGRDRCRARGREFVEHGGRISNVSRGRRDGRRGFQ